MAQSPKPFSGPNPAQLFRYQNAAFVAPPAVSIPATVGASPGIAAFTSGAGQATGAAQRGATAGAGAFSVPAGKATGAATSGAVAGSAAFTSPAGNAAGAALRGAVAGTGVFTFPPGQAQGGAAAVVAPAAPGIAAFSAAQGSAVGAASVSAAPGVVVSASPAGQAVGQTAQAAAVGAAPGEVFTSSPVGAASVQTPGGIGFWLPPLIFPERIEARAGARAGEARTASPAGSARGGRAAVARGTAAGVRMQLPAGGARGGAVAGAMPGKVLTLPAPGGARGFRGPTREMLAAVLLLASRRGMAQLSNLPAAMQRGQDASDELVAQAKAAARRILGGDVARLNAALAAAERSPGHLRAALLKAHGRMDPRKLAALTYRVLVLAELSGRLAAKEQAAQRPTG